jgi:TPR repeat protein
VRAVERVVPKPATKPDESEEKLAAISTQAPALNPPVGDKAAFEYYLQYAHRGNAEATLKVAQSYESGRGIAQNNVWACGWYELAARRGVLDANARKEAVAQKLQPPERKQCQDFADGTIPKPVERREDIAKPTLSPPAGERPAFLYYLAQAHGGNGEATMKVAESYESGRGTAQNNVWACAWYELAARRGIANAKERKEALAQKLQPPEQKQCQEVADGQSGSG